MNLRTLEWDDELLAIFNIPRAMLPVDPVLVRSRGVRRHAARRPGRRRSARSPATSAISRPRPSARSASAPGEAKNTYGTGNFMLLNTGTQIVPSKAGLLTTVCYRMGGETIYALEGSIAVTGSAVQWLRDQLGIIASASEIEALAQLGARQRRHLLRAGVLGTLRALLALRRARRDRRAVALQHQGAPRARHARGDLLPDARRPRRDGPGLGRPPRRAQGGRRRDGQRHADAAPGRRPRRPGRPPGRRGDDGARRRLRGRPRRRLLEGPRRAARELAHGQALGAALERGPARRGVRAAGRRRSRGRSTGFDVANRYCWPSGLPSMS